MKSVSLGQEEVLLANVGGNFYVIAIHVPIWEELSQMATLMGSKSSVLFMGQYSTWLPVRY